MITRNADNAVRVVVEINQNVLGSSWISTRLNGNRRQNKRITAFPKFIL
jgi:hypothetical protein